jgi:hypothetical protein
MLIQVIHCHPLTDSYNHVQTSSALRAGALVNFRPGVSRLVPTCGEQ